LANNISNTYAKKDNVSKQQYLKPFSRGRNSSQSMDLSGFRQIWAIYDFFKKTGELGGRKELIAENK
jgi:hypothetical protein